MSNYAESYTSRWQTGFAELFFQFNNFKFLQRLRSRCGSRHLWSMRDRRKIIWFRSIQPSVVFDSNLWSKCCSVEDLKKVNIYETDNNIINLLNVKRCEQTHFLQNIIINQLRLKNCTTRARYTAHLLSKRKGAQLSVQNKPTWCASALFCSRVKREVVGGRRQNSRQQP